MTKIKKKTFFYIYTAKHAITAVTGLIYKMFYDNLTIILR